jgi:hypothetical protein
MADRTYEDGIWGERSIEFGGGDGSTLAAAEEIASHVDHHEGVAERFLRTGFLGCHPIFRNHFLSRHHV